MFNNVGKTIKGLASVLTWLGIIVSFVVFLILISIDEGFIGQAVIVLIVGALVSWLSSLTLYGFGELVDNSKAIAEAITKETCSTIPAQSPQKKASDKNASVNSDFSHKSEQLYETMQSNLGTCDLCEETNIPVFDAKIEDSLGIRYRTVCGDCFVKHNCTENKKK